jgi:hypothetical protein
MQSCYFARTVVLYPSCVRRQLLQLSQSLSFVYLSRLPWNRVDENG